MHCPAVGMPDIQNKNSVILGEIRPEKPPYRAGITL
jgi:hypothetical protein